MRRINKHCKYFPCHVDIEDCTFCWCPFYPCLNNNLGYYARANAKNKKIWACDKCGWIHKKSTVDKFYRLIKDDFKIEF